MCVYESSFPATQAAQAGNSSTPPSHAQKQQINTGKQK